jgi:hypothetical protein
MELSLSLYRSSHNIGLVTHCRIVKCESLNIPAISQRGSLRKQRNTMRGPRVVAHALCATAESGQTAFPGARAYVALKPTGVFYVVELPIYERRSHTNYRVADARECLLHALSQSVNLFRS